MNGWYPENLYRYRSTNTPHFVAELEQLKENRVWLSYLDTQNDPFEGCVSYRVQSYEEFTKLLGEYRSFLKQQFPTIDPLPKRISRQDFNLATLQCPLFHKEVRKLAVVSCFSKGWQNTLLWGHYADAFNGICLQFTASPLAKTDGPHFFPVQYWKDNPPHFTPVDYFLETRLSEFAKTLKENSSDFRHIANIAHEKAKLAATSKSFDWAYEEEFRLISYQGVPGYYRVGGMELTGVIFGPRAEASTYATVMDTLGEDYTYYKLDMKHNSYGYDRKPIYTPTQLEKLSASM